MTAGAWPAPLGALEKSHLSGMTLLARRFSRGQTWFKLSLLVVKSAAFTLVSVRMWTVKYMAPCL